MAETLYGQAFETAQQRGSDALSAHSHAVQVVLGASKAVKEEVERLEDEYAAGMISCSYFSANRMVAILSVDA